MRISNQYSLGHPNKVHSYSYNTKPIDFYYKPNIDSEYNKSKVNSGDFYRQNLNDKTLITDINNNYLFNKPRHSITEGYNNQIIQKKYITNQSTNTKKMYVQGKASSANFSLDSSHFYKKVCKSFKILCCLDVHLLNLVRFYLIIFR